MVARHLITNNSRVAACHQINWHVKPCRCTRTPSTRSNIHTIRFYKSSMIYLADLICIREWIKLEFVILGILGIAHNAERTHSIRFVCLTLSLVQWIRRW